MSIVSWLAVAESGIIEWVIKATLVVALLAIAHALALRIASPATRHLLLVVAMLSLLALPIVGLIAPQWTPPMPLRGVVQAPWLAGAPPEEISPVARPGDSGAGVSASEVQVSAKSDASPGASGVSPGGWKGPLGILYAAGVLVLLARLAAGRLALRALRGRSTAVKEPEWTELMQELIAAEGIRKPIDLYRTSSDVSPVTWGTRRPVILIPALAESWAIDRRRAVLLHELAHVARRDALAQTLALLTAAVYWFHPGVWWIARRLRIERELACDERVLAAGTPPEDYASYLLEIARGLSLPREATFAIGASGPAQLEARMRAILNGTRIRTIRGSGAGRWIVSFIAISLVGLMTADLRGEHAAGRAPEPSLSIASEVAPSPHASNGTSTTPTEGSRFNGVPVEEDALNPGTSAELSAQDHLDPRADAQETNLSPSPAPEGIPDDLPVDILGLYAPSVASQALPNPAAAKVVTTLAGCIGVGCAPRGGSSGPVQADISADAQSPSDPATRSDLRECSFPVSVSVVCTGNFARTARAMGPSRNPVGLAGPPLCPHRLVGRISGSTGRGQANMNWTPQRQARSLGADAYIVIHSSREFDSLQRVIATHWEAIAIAYTDRRDPNCYR